MLCDVKRIETSLYLVCYWSTLALEDSAIFGLLACLVGAVSVTATK
jgi:hypothetical protein